MKSEGLYASQGGPIILSQVIFFIIIHLIQCHRTEPNKTSRINYLNRTNAYNNNPTMTLKLVSISRFMVPYPDSTEIMFNPEPNR